MGRRRYDEGGYWETYFPRSTPRQAKGGIKAQSQRGSFGESWWAGRWNAVLESFHIGARLSRGRSYARRGQVLSIDIEKGRVRAKVQGSRPTPYQVTIGVKPLSEADWKTLAAELARQALFTAKLLAGEMPQEIEQVFQEAGLSLFPAKRGDLQTDCSCPDWSNPCKHVAAVYYLLGEEFDRDPFLIFRLRGKTREELIELLGAAGAVASAAATAPVPPSDTQPPPPIPPEPLPADESSFWTGGPLPDDFFGEVRPAPETAALPRRLGGFPFWRAEQRLLDVLDPIYAAASSRGMHVFLGPLHSPDPAESRTRT